MKTAMPFLLRVCLAGEWGRDSGNIQEAGFLYLTGTPDAAHTDMLETKWNNRMFVPMTEAWEQMLLSRYPDIHAITRYEMYFDMKTLDKEKLTAYTKDIPSEYRLTPFDKELFAKKPFEHGSNFRDFADFSANGVGFAAMYGEEAVASASSFLTRWQETELDVSTAPAHRRKHLALACCAAILLECRKRGLQVHWDAQNPASQAMAEKLGGIFLRSYSAYCFRLPDFM